MLKREKTFDAYRAKKCSEKDNVVLALRTIGDRLYAVVEEKLVRPSARVHNLHT